MTTNLKQIYYFAAIAIVFALNIATFAQTPAYRVNDRQVKTLINRIETKTNTFRNSVDNALNNSNINGTNREDNINSFVEDFDKATNTLKDNFNDRRSTNVDVQEVLNRAVLINNFMRNNSLSRTTQTQWTSIRTDLNTLANYYRVSWNWNNTTNNQAATNPYYVTDNQLKTIISQLETKTNTFQQSIKRGLNNSNIDGSNREDNINSYVDNFENATNSLKNNFNNRRSTTNDVQEVLNRANFINSLMNNNNQFSRTSQTQWNSIRTDLNTLANYYRVSWNWNNQNNQNYPNNQNNSFDSRLTGAYRLNVGQSDNVANTIERAISNVNYNENQRERTQNNLQRRLISPETIMIAKRGQQITLASSMMSQVAFNADGVSRSETSDNGRTVNIKATATNSELTINYEGDRMNDYYVSFSPTNNNQLRISRRVYLENRNETVTINSVYDKTDQTPNWNTAPYQNTTNNNTNNDNFVVPNNTQMIATLDSALSTKTAKNNDRFTMTVNSPSQFNGAIIEGRVDGEKSGVVSGRATLSLSFETIRLRNGTTYRFAGIVEQVRQPNGSNVNVNNEGTVRDGSQTTKTATRAGVGAVLGAIIGAIAGGGQGAAIGAGIGAGAGAGSVILQGRDNLDLPSGSEFTITATAPNNVANNR